MSSYDAYCVKKGQLKHMMERDGKKQKYFIQAKTLEKNSCKPE